MRKGLENIKMVIFDFDGTLADTQQGILETMRVTLDKMCLPPAPDEAMAQLIGLPLEESFHRLTGKEGEELKKIADVYRDNFTNIIHHTVRLFPNVKETIQSLFEKGFVTAIATSRRNYSLNMLMKELGLEPFIKLTAGDEDVKEKKPAPEMVLKLLADINMDATKALVVGDTVYDIEMGQRAGCFTCGVTYGNNSRQQLEEQHANFLVDDFGEILQLLDE